MSVNIEGIDKFNRLLDKIPASFNESLAKTTRSATQAAYDAFDRWADKHRVTGNMRNAVYSHPTGQHTWEIGVDSSKAKYAPFVSHGTKPHPIKPNKRKSLRWTSGNGFKFAKLVNHPGYKGDPIEEKAIQAAEDKFEQLANRITTDIERQI